MARWDVLGKVFAQLIRKTVGSGRVFELAPREPSRHSAGGDTTSETQSVKPKQPSETPMNQDSEWKSPKIWRVATTGYFENFAKNNSIVQNLLMTDGDLDGEPSGEVCVALK